MGEAEGVAARVEQDSPALARLLVGERRAQLDAPHRRSVEVIDREVQMELLAAVLILSLIHI